MQELTRAEQVLAGVLRSVSAHDGSSWLDVTVVNSWTESSDVFCLVYRQPRALQGVTLGLRRMVEPDWTVDGVIDEVVVCELGEPLGSLYDSLQPDDNGVLWWNGNPPEWKELG